MRFFSILFLLLVFLVKDHRGLCQVMKHKVISLGANVNSPQDEQNPVLDPSGKRLFFTVGKSPDNIGGTKDEGDIWYTEMDSTGNWSAAKNIGEPLNNRYYNCVIGFFNYGRGVYLVGHYDKSGRKSDTQGISVSYQRDDNWSYPEPVDVRYFKKYAEHHSVSLSFDRRIMLHSLESYNSRGAEDIYVSFRNADGTWTDIENLGSTINTNFQEMTPFLAADNTTLFFASNGHEGYGSMDIFMSKRLDDSWKSWSEPVNLGDPINTPGRELYYYMIPGINEAFFCSTQNSDGYGDIKRYILLPEEIIPAEEPEELTITEEPVQVSSVEETSIIVSGKVLDNLSNRSIDGKITVLSNNTQLATLSSDPGTGEYKVVLEKPDTYLFRVDAKGYLSYEEKFELAGSGSGEIEKDFRLEPIELGKTYKLENVLFFRSTADLIDSSYVQLDMVLRMMQENPDIDIELHGHTDNQGNARKNVVLSQERVDVVKQYLVDHGIDESRITGKGWGGSRPIASNANEKSRQLNRRVEFIIKEKQ